MVYMELWTAVLPPEAIRGGGVRTIGYAFFYRLHFMQDERLTAGRCSSSRAAGAAAGVRAGAGAVAGRAGARAAACNHQLACQHNVGCM